MKRGNVQRVHDLCERVAKIALEVIEDTKRTQYDSANCGIKSAALRRASMDLTRALAKMRKEW